MICWLFINSRSECCATCGEGTKLVPVKEWGVVAIFLEGAMKGKARVAFAAEEAASSPRAQAAVLT